MMFRRCKVRHTFWLDEFRHAWIPTERAIVDAEIDLVFQDESATFKIVELDTLVMAGRFLPHVEEWPVERAS